MLSIMIWFIGALALAGLSWRAFAEPRSSRFVRLLGEATLWALLVMNASGWLPDGISIPQIVSWIFLAVSLVLAFSGFYALSGIGVSRGGRARRPGSDG